MPSRHAVPLLLPLLLLGALAAPRPVRAAWPNDPNVNVPLCTAIQDQQHPAMIPDGTGGAIVVWQDARTSGGFDIYVRRVDATGTALWTPDGVPLCTAPGDQTDPVIASDGAGGAIVAWTDGRIAGDLDIYAQHILASGMVDPGWPLNGAPVCVLPAFQTIGGIAADGFGGVIIAWTDQRGNVDYRPDVYAQRLGPAGNPMWVVNGVPAIARPYPQQIPNNLLHSVIADGVGGGIVCWEDHLAGNWDIRAQRLDAGTGFQMWGTIGVDICSATGDQNLPTMVPDGAGGAILTWQDGRLAANMDIYAQRVNSGGVTMWAPNGNLVCGDPFPQFAPRIVSDGAGGSIVSWGDNRNAATLDIYAQRMSPLGAPLWAPNGMPVCVAPGDQELTGMSRDGAGGAVVSWSDRRNPGGADAYAQRLFPGGMPAWALNGVAVSTAAGDQTEVRTVADGTGGAVLAWTDGRSGTSLDIYTQGVSASGALGATGSGPLPGTPLQGLAFFQRLRENFIYPPNHAGSSEPPIAFQLPETVEPGFLVLLDDASRPSADSTNWSDVIWFPVPDPAGGGSQAMFISDPPEHPFTDADLAGLGLSIAAIRTGNTVYRAETIPYVTYAPADPSSGAIAEYRIHSDVDTLPPGAPLQGAGFHVAISEPPESGVYPEPVVTQALPTAVMPGYVVLLENPNGAAEDSTNWSDVVMFGQLPTGAPGMAMVSDADSIPGAVFHRGINSDDLAPLGVTVLDVLESNTMYYAEQVPTVHVAANPITGQTAIYNIYSDVGDAAVGPGSAPRLALRASNPAVGRAAIAFTVPRAQAVRLEIFDVGGQRVRRLQDGAVAAGEHRLSWDGTREDGGRAAPGIYLVRLESRDGSRRTKLTLLH